jgi:TPP-dependent trihydroxycyclohexane-1,2-dione (THcHDO) dehydratase
MHDMKKTIFAFLLLTGPAFAQGLPDPVQQQAQAQAQIDQTLQQTQQNNSNLQFQLQQNEQRQQQQYNAMQLQQYNSLPPPVYQVPAYAPPIPLTPPPVQK